MNQFLLEFVNKNFSQPGNAIDIGAGRCFDVACMKQLGWKVEGIDLNMGVDLEKPYKSEGAPFDLVYSNYVLQKINNQRQFVKNCFDNLKDNGFLFITTFDSSDKLSKRGVNKEGFRDLLKEEGFDAVEYSVVPFYDNDIGHNHWHNVLKITAKKKEVSKF